MKLFLKKTVHILQQQTNLSIEVKPLLLEVKQEKK